MNEIHKSQSTIEVVEKFLSAMLEPVTPNPRFVKDLHRRLVAHLPVKRLVAKTSPRQYTILAFASLAGSAFFLITGIRAIFSFMGAVSLLHILRYVAAQKRVISQSKPV